MSPRAVTTAHVAVGMAAAAFSLFAVTLDPTQLQGSGCAATHADLDAALLHLSDTALLLLLSGATQAALAAAAMLVAPGSRLSRALTFFAHLLSGVTYFHLNSVAPRVLDVTVGHCFDRTNTVLLLVHYAVLAVTVFALFLIGLVVILSGHDGVLASQ